MTHLHICRFCKTSVTCEIEDCELPALRACDSCLETQAQAQKEKIVTSVEPSTDTTHTPIPPKTNGTISICVLCKKPLGQESKDLGYLVCHDCRKCATCNFETSAKESAWCIEHKQSIKHARCMSISDGKTIPEQIDIANFCRLLTEQTTQLENYDFDQKMLFLRTLQANAAQIAIWLNREKANKAKIKASIEAETQIKKANKEAILAKPIERKKLTDAAKAIKALTTVGVKYSAAAQTILAQEMKKGRTAEQARFTILEAMISLGTPEGDAPEILDGKIQ